MAPMVSERPLSSMPDIPSISDMSMICGGPASRNFIVGNSV
jgi:hypothetical protein